MTTDQRRQPYPTSFLQGAHSPINALEHHSNGCHPFMREDFDSTKPLHHSKFTETAEAQNKTLRQYLDAYQSPSEYAGVVPQVYYLTNAAGTLYWSYYGRENLPDSTPLRAFDYLWSNIKSAKKIKWTVTDWPFDRTTNEYLLMQKYVEMHTLLCNEGCGSEWHPSAEEVRNVIGNLGGDEEEQFTVESLNGGGYSLPATPQQSMVVAYQGTPDRPDQVGGPATPLEDMVGFDPVRGVPLTPRFDQFNGLPSPPNMFLTLNSPGGTVIMGSPVYRSSGPLLTPPPPGE